MVANRTGFFSCLNSKDWTCFSWSDWKYLEELLQQPLSSPSCELQLFPACWQGELFDRQPSVLENTLTACNSLWQKCSLKVKPVVLKSTINAKIICRSLAAKTIVKNANLGVFVFDTLYNSGFKLHNIESKPKIWSFRINPAIVTNPQQWLLWKWAGWTHSPNRHPNCSLKPLYSQCSILIK